MIRIYVYMCVHICIMNLHVHGCVHSFSRFPCYLGLTMTAPLCLYPILRFNKAHWFYLQQLPVRGCCNFIRLCYCMVSWLFFKLIHVCIYVFLIDTTLSCISLVLCFWREMTLSWHSYFYSFFSSSHLEVTCYRNVLHFWYLKKAMSVGKSLWSNLVYMEREATALWKILLFCCYYFTGGLPCH